MGDFFFKAHGLLSMYHGLQTWVTVFLLIFLFCDLYCLNSLTEIIIVYISSNLNVRRRRQRCRHRRRRRLCRHRHRQHFHRRHRHLQRIKPLKDTATAKHFSLERKQVCA
jgi:hypothetical protein